MIIVFYDGWCPVCTKRAIRIKQLGSNFNVRILSFRNITKSGNQLVSPHLYRSMKNEFYIYHQKKHTYYSGMRALIELSKAIPIMLFFLPIIYFFHYFGKGELLYQFIQEKLNFIPVGYCYSPSCMYHTSLSESEGHLSP